MPQVPISPSFFVPSHIGHAKRKAKQLRRAFPRLTLSLAQQVTAKAFGFPDWHWLDQAIKQGWASSPIDASVGPALVQARRETQLWALTNGASLSAPEAEDFQAIWELTTGGLSLSAATSSWPEIPDDPEVDVFLRRASKLGPVAIHMGSSEQQPHLIVMDRSEPLPSFESRREQRGKGKRRRFTFGLAPHPLETIEIPPEMLQDAISRWQASDAEFFVAYSGANVGANELVSVRRLNNLISRVVPELMSACTGHPTAVHVKAESTVERLVRTAAYWCNCEGFRETFTPRSLPAVSCVDMMRVQITSRQHLDYEKSVMMLAYEAWWGKAEQSIAAGFGHCRDAAAALRGKARAVMHEDSSITMQYLLPNQDSVSIVLGGDCYRMLPAAFQDTARQFALERAAEEILWFLRLERK